MSRAPLPSLAGRSPAGRSLAGRSLAGALVLLAACGTGRDLQPGPLNPTEAVGATPPRSNPHAASVVSPAKVAVVVDVDFGPLHRAPLARTVQIAAQADVVVATRAAFEVEQRYLCCDDLDVWSVAGVGPDPRRDQYWMWLLNGALGPNAAVLHRVVADDRITWKLSKGATADVGALGANVAIAALDSAARDALWQIGAEERIVLQRNPAESLLAFAERARAAGAELVLSAAGTGHDGDERSAAERAAPNLEWMALDVAAPELEVRLEGWEELGNRLDRLGAARIAARLDRPLRGERDTPAPSPPHLR